MTYHYSMLRFVPDPARAEFVNLGAIVGDEESGDWDVRRLPFDFAVHNGKALQLVQCWSFQVQGQDELAEQLRSWAWLVHALRDRGGSASVDGEPALTINPDVEIASVFVPPVAGAPAHAYEEAAAIFDAEDVFALPEERADEVGQHAAHQLGAVT